MKNELDRANRVLTHWMNVLFYDSFGDLKEGSTVDTITETTNVRTIVLKNGDTIKVTVDYFTNSK